MLTMHSNTQAMWNLGGKLSCNIHESKQPHIGESKCQCKKIKSEVVMQDNDFTFSLNRNQLSR